MPARKPSAVSKGGRALGLFGRCGSAASKSARTLRRARKPQNVACPAGALNCWSVVVIRMDFGPGRELQYSGHRLVSQSRVALLEGFVSPHNHSQTVTPFSNCIETAQDNNFGTLLARCVGRSLRQRSRLS
jgi:hypothetical protein